MIKLAQSTKSASTSVQIVAQIVLGIALACLAEASYGKSSYPTPYAGTYNSQNNQNSYTHYDDSSNSGESNEYPTPSKGAAPAYHTSYAKPAYVSPYGPYHSYAARPAIYGGKKLYHYKGYTRHYPPPPITGYKQKRAYPNAPYGLKPVKALALIPAYPKPAPYQSYPKPTYFAYPKAPAYPAYPTYPTYPSYPTTYPTYPSYPTYPKPRPMYPTKYPTYGHSKRYRTQGYPSNNGYNSGSEYSSSSGSYNYAPRYPSYGQNNKYKSNSYGPY